MARFAANASTSFELPAPVCVCALLVEGALTKGGHTQWAIGAMILLCALFMYGRVREFRGLAAVGSCAVQRASWEYSASPERHVVRGCRRAANSNIETFFEHAEFEPERVLAAVERFGRKVS
jgi:hypothetical protein